MRRCGYSIFSALILIVLVSCSPIVFSQYAELDTPSRHVENGMKLLNYGKITDAFREFTRANELDPDYAPAYVGKGLCYGLMGDYAKSIEFMKKAEKYIKASD